MGDILIIESEKVIDKLFHKMLAFKHSLFAENYQKL